MNTVGDRETGTQERVVAFFQKVLGYTYLGNWQARQKNSNIDTVLLSDWLRSSGHDEAIISKVLFELEKAAALGGTQTLVDANREVYERLRYGVNVQPNTGEHRTTVKLIDWEHPFNNDFGIAEEVTLKGENTKRPDVVLYINGIAIGVLELKRSMDYRQYLSEIEGLSSQITEPENQAEYSSTINTGPLRAFFNNLEELPIDRRAAAAFAIDAAIRETKQDNWRGNRFKKRQVRNAIARVIREELSGSNLDIDTLLELAVNQSEY